MNTREEEAGVAEEAEDSTIAAITTTVPPLSSSPEEEVEVEIHFPENFWNSVISTLFSGQSSGVAG